MGAVQHPLTGPMNIKKIDSKKRPWWYSSQNLCEYREKQVEIQGTQNDIACYKSYE